MKTNACLEQQHATTNIKHRRRLQVAAQPSVLALGGYDGAPRYLASVIKSPNTPAAVTAGPAPGPRIINGGLLHSVEG